MVPVALVTTLEGGESRPSQTTASITIADDQETLGRTLGFGGSAKVRFGLVSVGGAAEYVEKVKHNRHSGYVVVSANWTAATKILEQYKLREDALTLLRTNPVAFHNRCGDQFVAAIVTGGYVHAVAETRRITESQRTSMKASLSAQYLFVSGKVSTKSSETEGSTTQYSNFRIFQAPGIHKSPTSPAELVEIYERPWGSSDFPEATPIKFVSVPYTQATNWPANASLEAVSARIRKLRRLVEWDRAAAAGIEDLRMAAQYPRVPECKDAAERRSRYVRNLDLTRDSYEDAAARCLDDPSGPCDVSNVREPSLTDVEKYLSDCADIDGGLAREAARQNSAKDAAAAEQANRDDESARRKARIGMPDGDPCPSWRLTSITYKAPARKPDGSAWDVALVDADPDLRVRLQQRAGEVSLASTTDSRAINSVLTKTVMLAPGEQIGIRVIDKDLNFDDEVGAASFTVPTQLENGSVGIEVGGAPMALQMQCES